MSAARNLENEQSEEAKIGAMLGELSEQLGGDQIIELVEIYTENSALQISKIEKAISLGDLKTVRDEAHSLKSSSANMGAELLSSSCAKIEKAPLIDPQLHSLVIEMKSRHEAAVGFMNGWKARNS